MAEHVWFVPAAGGGYSELRPGPPVNLIRNSDQRYINVQWSFTEFPYNQNPPVALPNLDATAVTRFTNIAPAAPDTLLNCFARFNWRSASDCPATKVVSGGRLTVGTVFSRYLEKYPMSAPPADPPADQVPPLAGTLFQWNTVEAWAKFLVVDKARFSRITFSLNGVTGGPAGMLGTGNWLPNAVNGSWRVAYARYPMNGGESWEGWTDRNLRAVLTFDGVDNSAPANAGQTEVWVEWFAFRLSDEVSPR
jgi:hypothetical protein